MSRPARKPTVWPLRNGLCTNGHLNQGLNCSQCQRINDSLYKRPLASGPICYIYHHVLGKSGNKNGAAMQLLIVSAHKCQSVQTATCTIALTDRLCVIYISLCFRKIWKQECKNVAAVQMLTVSAHVC